MIVDQDNTQEKKWYMRQVLQAKGCKLQYINGLILKSENSSDNQFQVISQNENIEIKAVLFYIKIVTEKKPRIKWKSKVMIDSTTNSK